MPSNQRSTYLPYIPGPAPAPTISTGESIRATWDEFYRIATSLIDLDRPVSVALRVSEDITVSPAPPWDRLFNEGLLATWEQPPGQMDPATGIWTAPQEGLYQIIASMQLPPFTAPAAKSYHAEIQVTWTHINGSPTTVEIFSDGGLDDQYVTVVAIMLLPCLRGDTFTFDGRAVHANKTGTITAKAGLQIVRQSGIR